MDNIIRVLHGFYLAWVLKINIHKSNYYGDIPFIFTYGLPLVPILKSIASWERLIEQKDPSTLAHATTMRINLSPRPSLVLLAMPMLNLLIIFSLNASLLSICGSSFLDGVIFLFFKLLLGILSMIESSFGYASKRGKKTHGSIRSYLGMTGSCIPFRSTEMAMVRAAFGFFLKMAFKFAGLALPVAPRVFFVWHLRRLRIGSSFLPFSRDCLGFHQNPITE
ncbi:hypothetical protein Tco_1313406 [Tanacetum coccineum]